MPTVTAPRSDIDIFADEVVSDPYPYYKALRDAGRAVYLEGLDIFALARYEVVRAAAIDWETFSSSQAAGFNDAVNFFAQGNVEFTDPPDHDRMRAILQDWLSPRRIRAFTDHINQKADELVTSLLDSPSFDGMTAIAQALPGLVVTDLVGLPPELRDKMIEWSEATIQIVGPLNARTEAAFPVVEELLATVMSMTKDDLAPGTMGRAIFEAVERGELEEHDGFQSLWDYTGPSIDTTISAIGTALWQLGQNPEQLELLRSDPSLIPAACNEVLRFEAPLQMMGRRTRREWEGDGFRIPVGAQVAMLFGSANRDERQYPDPDSFDITRNPLDHLGFGFGVHHCVGASLARAEIEAVLRSLARHVRRIEIGEPVRKLHNIVRLFKELPIQLRTN